MICAETYWIARADGTTLAEHDATPWIAPGPSISGSATALTDLPSEALVFRTREEAAAHGEPWQVMLMADLDGDDMEQPKGAD